MILRADKISKQYFRKTKLSNYFYAVKDVDFTLEPGKITAVMGRSGSGKSTLLNILAGLLAPTEGKVFLDETDIYSLGDSELSKLRNEHIGIIPQGQTGLASLTVLENVKLPYLMYHKKDDINKYAENLLETVGISELASACPTELSGGENRRLAIARALINRPSVILADEPTSDLDDENTAAVLELLRKTAENGAAVMLVTHENEAVEYASSVWRMNGGILTKQ